MKKKLLAMLLALSMLTALFTACAVSPRPQRPRQKHLRHQKPRPPKTKRLRSRHR